MALASAFVRGMDVLAVAKQPSTQLGENGAVELTAAGVGDHRVALFFALVRGLEDDGLNQHMRDCLSEADRLPTISERAAAVADLFVMAFQTRHCRGGKGEKKLFDKLFLNLYDLYPNTCERLVPLIARFGSFKDYFRLLDLMGDLPKYDSIRNTIVTRVANQLLADDRRLAKAAETAPIPAEATEQAAVSAESTAAPAAAPAVSLCAKYAPREGTAFVNSPHGRLWFRKLREVMFPSSTNSKAEYRKLVARLTAVLDIPERKMASNQFSEIDFGRVPSLCLNRCRKAFLNEIVVKPTLLVKPILTSFKGARRPRQKSTGTLRHPDREDRMKCRENLLVATRSKALHGKALHPHTIVAEIMRTKCSEAELAIFDVQWEKIRENLVQSMERIQKQQESQSSGRPIDFTRLVPLVDVSSSMSGDPMHAAIAMGVLVSEVNHASFRDRFISFDTSPRWIDLSKCESISKKVKVAAASPWGGSTNLVTAFELILEVIKTCKLPAEEVPDLIIFSDMQFNQACNQSASHLTIIRKLFADVGMEICGKPYDIPRIVFWNLRAVRRGGFPATANEDNVQMLSGFSPAMLENVLSGEPLEEPIVADNDSSEEESVAVSTKPKVNPYQTLRKVLDNSKYDLVRKVLNQSKEKLLEYYSFTSPQELAKEASAAVANMAVADDEDEGTGIAMEDVEVGWEML